MGLLHVAAFECQAWNPSHKPNAGRRGVFRAAAAMELAEVAGGFPDPAICAVKVPRPQIRRGYAGSAMLILAQNVLAPNVLALNFQATEAAVTARRSAG